MIRQLTDDLQAIDDRLLTCKSILQGDQLGLRLVAVGGGKTQRVLCPPQLVMHLRPRIVRLAELRA